MTRSWYLARVRCFTASASLTKGTDLRLAFEARDALDIRREKLGEDLQGDVAIELSIERQIHLAHAARTKRGCDFIRPESSAGREAHDKGSDLVSCKCVLFLPGHRKRTPVQETRSDP